MKPDAFARDFLLPLVAGGTLHVAAPLGRAGLARLRATALDDALVADIDAARARTAAELMVDPIPPVLDGDAFRLAVALHDLLFLFHPRADAPLVRDHRLEEVAQYAAQLAALAPTDDADALVARHTVLHLLPSLSRTDVHVSFWVGKREFHGEEPPRRLVAWPNLRRVRQERRRVNCLAEAASHPLGGPVVMKLLDGSPLTDLLHPLRLEPRFELGRHAHLLASPALCRLVAYAYLVDGIDHVGGALATAALAELDTQSPERARFACAFVAHLHLCLLLAPPDGARDSRSPRAPTRFATGLGQPSSDALRDFYGLFAALDRTVPSLAAPPDVRDDPRLARRLAEHATACAATCGPTRLHELQALCARAVGTAALAGTPS